MLRLIRALTVKQRDEWMAAFDTLPDDEKDIHWLPEYVEAHQLDRKGCLAIIEDDRGLSLTTFMADGGNPYGYGGVVGGPHAFIPKGKPYRFHPLVGWNGKEVGRVEKCVVAIDLEKPLKLSKGHKSAARRAERSGYSVECVTDELCYAWFSLVYDAAMKRQGAASGWRLDEGYFKNLKKMMGDSCIFFSAENESTQEIDSACIVLHAFGAAYYHFAGSYLNAPGANHLMVLRVAEWAKEKGYRWLHLGGGVTADPDDPLLTFKKGFGGELLPVYVYEGEPGELAH